MNIALGALIIVLLVLPAISFRFGIQRNNELKELVATVPVSDVFWIFLFVPLGIHMIGIWILSSLGQKINYSIIYKTIIGDKDLVIDNPQYQGFVLDFLSYTFVCFIAGYLIGYVFSLVEGWSENRKWISSFTLSQRLGLRNNKWYKYFEVEAMSKELESQIDLILVDVLTNTKETTTIYSGILTGYHFKSNSKDLGSIVLTSAFRRDLRKEHKKKYHPPAFVNTYSDDMGTNIKIPGDLLIIPYEQIININISFIKTTPPS